MFVGTSRRSRSQFRKNSRLHADLRRLLTIWRWRRKYQKIVRHVDGSPIEDSSVIKFNHRKARSFAGSSTNFALHINGNHALIIIFISLFNFLFMLFIGSWMFKSFQSCWFCSPFSHFGVWWFIYLYIYSGLGSVSSSLLYLLLICRVV